jgi:hypothetical protein
MRPSNHAEKLVFSAFVISLLALQALSGCSQKAAGQSGQTSLAAAEQSGRISSIEGQVLWLPPGDPVGKYAKKDDVFDGADTFRAGPNAKAEFIMRNNNLIRIGSDTEIQFANRGENWTYSFLTSGTASFYNRSEDVHIWVATRFGHVEALEKGCAFDLYVSDRSAELVTREGRVDFIHDNSSTKYKVLPGSLIVGESGLELPKSTSSQIAADWKEWNKGQDGGWDKDFAWVAALICTALTIYFATEYAGCSPRIFASMAMFAMAWAVLLPYYWELAGNELLSQYQGILLALSGGPLRRQAEFSRGEERLEVRGWDRWALLLLLVLIVPHFAKLPFHPNFVLEYYPIIDTWIGTGLLLLGYFSVGHGVKSLTEAQSTPSDKRWWKGWEWYLFACVLGVYAVAEIVYSGIYTVDFCRRVSIIEVPDIPMDPNLRIAFGVLKILTTLLYLRLVMRTVERHDKCAVCSGLGTGR